MVGLPERFTLKGYYEFSIEERLSFIRSLATENGVFLGIRENHHSDWKIEQVCREILFDNSKLLKRLKESVDDDRAEIKKLN